MMVAQIGHGDMVMRLGVHDPATNTIRWIEECEMDGTSKTPGARLAKAKAALQAAERKVRR